MRNLGLIMAVIIATIFITSCEKETEKLQPEAKVSIRQKIINFKGEISNTNRSASTNTYTVENGLWNVESVISLYRTRIDQEYSNRVKHNLSFKINISNNELAFNGLQKLYFEILDEMKIVWDSYNGNYKIYNLISITYNPNEENNINVKLVFSYGDTEIANRSANIRGSYFDNFTASANFMYGELIPSSCGNSAGIDAANAINNYVHQRIYSAYETVQGTAYVINKTEKYIDAGMFTNPNDTDPYDNYYSNYLFSNNSDLPNYHMCMPKMEVQNYANLTWTLINKTSENGFPLKPAGKQLVDLDLHGDLVPLANSTYIEHRGTVTYGNIEIEPLIYVKGFN